MHILIFVVDNDVGLPNLHQKISGMTRPFPLHCKHNYNPAGISNRSYAHPSPPSTSLVKCILVNLVYGVKQG